MCRLFTENAEIACNSKGDEWVPGRWRVRAKDPPGPPGCVSHYLPHHTGLASCPSFLLCHCRASHNMNDFFIFLVSVYPCPASTHLFLCHCCHFRGSFPSFSIPVNDLQTTWTNGLQSRSGLFPQRTTHLHPYTWSRNHCGCCCANDSAGFVLCTSRLVMLCGPAFWKPFPRWQHSNITSSLKHLAFQSKLFWPPCRQSILISCSHPRLQSLHVFSLMSSPSEHEYFSHDKDSPHQEH